MASNISKVKQLISDFSDIRNQDDLNAKTIFDAALAACTDIEDALYVCKTRHVTKNELIAAAIKKAGELAVTKGDFNDVLRLTECRNTAVRNGLIAKRASAPD